ncbi:MAG: IgGFc-binding protein, partial [Flavobacteriaceae bacterium]|nr:IgGFc-binding protein [Flavobacteriaceae bacterium]
MTVLKFIKLTFFSLFFFFSINSFSQFSKTHYIPPISTSGFGSSSPEIQYLYVSTPNENPVNVIITPIGGTPLAVTVSNSQPYEYFMGDGSDTNFIALSGDSGAVYTDKGYIIEGEDLIYVSARLFTSSSYYQAAGLVSKGLAALGKTFRVGTFESVGSDPAGNFLNFVSVLATEDNTTVNFSDFPNGATIINNAATNDILLNSGESYVIAIQPTSVNPDNDNAMIGVLVESDKPIAVNSGSITGSNQNTDTDANGQDAGMDQIVPLERVGTEYIFVRGIGPDQIERPLIVAHEADTEVYVNGALEFTIALAGEHWSIPSSFYGVSYDQYDVGPEIGVSSNMYVQTSKPAFAYQFLGGIRPGVDGPFGAGTGVPNQGMFFVPPINCQTPSIVNNIAAINKLGPDFTFEGVVTIVTETGSTVLINGTDIAGYPGEVQPVNGNTLFESYTVEGLTGNVSVESSSQVYVASFGAYDYATFGGYYSGFAYQPEIILDEISVDSEGCIPNLELRLNSISTFDQYQWYFNGEIIDGAVGNSFTPTEPGYYQISGAVDDCPGLLLSDDIPVSACPPDTDSDGVNDN